MFGYITTNHMELKVKEYMTYQSYYCGICQCLKKQHGQRARMVLSYDMTFLAILLQGLYESNISETTIHCPFHPMQKKQVSQSAASQYAADMNILLAYHNWEDDWVDDHNIKSKIAMQSIRNAYQRVIKQYPRQYQSVKQYIKQLSKLEKQKEVNLDAAANLTGAMFQEILIWKEDEWKETLGKIGFLLGKFIYYMDAYEDLEKDKEHHSYNPWIGISSDIIEETLKMIMAEATSYFEYLPIIENVEILRNILYSGVWIKYCQIKQQREE